MVLNGYMKPHDYNTPQLRHLRVKVQAWLWAFEFLCSIPLQRKIKEGRRLQLLTILHIVA
jgi:hypothetical protein